MLQSNAGTPIQPGGSGRLASIEIEEEEEAELLRSKSKAPLRRASSTQQVGPAAAEATQQVGLQAHRRRRWRVGRGPRAALPAPAARSHSAAGGGRRTHRTGCAHLSNLLPRLSPRRRCTPWSATISRGGS